MAGLKNVEADLVTHPHQGSQDQLQHHPPLVRHQVSHVLQDVELGPVEAEVITNKK